MIDPESLNMLIAVYEGHGWQLRQVITTDAKADRDLTVPVRSGIVDAAWFSRPPQDGGVAWEIRYLGPTQYALLEHLEENSPEFEAKLREIERRLAEAVTAKRTA